MISIINGVSEEIDQYMVCLESSVLADNYFQDIPAIRKKMLHGLERNEIYIAKFEGATAGLMRIDYAGMFGEFPLLRLIAVESSFRGRGIGGKMLDYYEKTAFEKKEKIFLCVSGFNHGPRKIYEKRGYSEIGGINGLYKENIIEHIMMKQKG